MTQRPYEQEASGALQWHSSLTPREFNGRHIPGDRAALARLRRASSIMEAAVEPATADLYAKLGFARQTAERDLPRAALIAAVLAHVRANTGGPIAAAIGTPRGGADSQQKITPLRFKRLVAARTPDELLTAFRRVIAILGDKADIRDLARQLLAFTDPDERKADIARTRFAFAYHGAADFAPGAEPNAEHSTVAKD